jgi:CO/xanthine dehydrogenase Mo-binding subunit
MSLADVAKKAIELGGVYDGHELPKDVNRYTVTSATALAGQGLMGVGRDSYPRDGGTFSYVAGFAEVEVDVETGAYEVLDYLAVADVGTVLHPHSLGGQVLGRSVLGMGHALRRRPCTTSTTVCRWPSASTRTGHRRSWTCRRT